MPLPRGVGVGPSDAAVQLDAHLVLPRRIVGLRHVELVVERQVAKRVREAHEPAWHVGLVAAALLQRRMRFVERHTCLDDGISGARGLDRIGGTDESGQCGVAGRRRRPQRTGQHHRRGNGEKDDSTVLHGCQIR